MSGILPAARTRRAAAAAGEPARPRTTVSLAARRDGADQLGHAASASPAARTSRLPTITPSAPAAAAAAACSGVPIPKPTATGTSVRAAARADDRARSPRAAGALAGRAGHRARCRGSRGRRRRSRARRSSGVVGATSGTSARPAVGAGLAHVGRLLEGQVGHDQPADRRPRRARRQSARGPARGSGWRNT